MIQKMVTPFKLQPGRGGGSPRRGQWGEWILWLTVNFKQHTNLANSISLGKRSFMSVCSKGTDLIYLLASFKRRETEDGW